MTRAYEALNDLLSDITYQTASLCAASEQEISAREVAEALIGTAKASALAGIILAFAAPEWCQAILRDVGQEMPELLEGADTILSPEHIREYLEDHPVTGVTAGAGS